MAAVLHVPDDLHEQVKRLAASQARTVDEVASEALKRYLAREWVTKLGLQREGISEHERSSLYELFTPVRGLLTDEEIDRIFSRE